jgi:hypothetical protein
MVKTNQLAIEVLYVPLPQNELGERRTRLLLLLLGGALRLLRTGVPDNPAVSTEVVELVQK